MKKYAEGSEAKKKNEKVCRGKWGLRAPPPGSASVKIIHKQYLESPIYKVDPHIFQNILY